MIFGFALPDFNRMTRRNQAAARPADLVGAGSHLHLVFYCYTCSIAVIVRSIVNFQDPPAVLFVVKLNRVDRYFFGRTFAARGEG